MTGMSTRIDVRPLPQYNASMKVHDVYSQDEHMQRAQRAGSPRISTPPIVGGTPTKYAEQKRPNYFLAIAPAVQEFSAQFGKVGR